MQIRSSQYVWSFNSFNSFSSFNSFYSFYPRRGWFASFVLYAFPTKGQPKLRCVLVWSFWPFWGAGTRSGFRLLLGVQQVQDLWSCCSSLFGIQLKLFHMGKTVAEVSKIGAWWRVIWRCRVHNGRPIDWQEDFWSRDASLPGCLPSNCSDLSGLSHLIKFMYPSDAILSSEPI